VFSLAWYLACVEEVGGEGGGQALSSLRPHTLVGLKRYLACVEEVGGEGGGQAHVIFEHQHVAEAVAPRAQEELQLVQL
jgi:hypothetical protein